MKEWYDECMDILVKDHGHKLGGGEPMIAEMPHGHFKGSINGNYASTLMHHMQYNTIVLEPIKNE